MCERWGGGKRKSRFWPEQELAKTGVRNTSEKYISGLCCYVILRRNGFCSGQFFRNQGVGKKSRAASSFFYRAIDDIPTRSVLQQFFDCVNTDALIVDHLSNALDPLDIPAGVISPCTFSDWVDKPLVFIAPDCSRVNIEQFGDHPDSHQRMFVSKHGCLV